MFRTIAFCMLTLLVLSGCKSDPAHGDDLDKDLDEVLREAHPDGKDAFILPDSDDFSAIPQDRRNPLTAAKVRLGQMLFHETGLGLNPKMAEGKNTYSCASCHFAEAGFQAGRFQGMGEGGIGFGTRGEGRQAHAGYAEDDLDVQPIRTPSSMNGAYQEVHLWNGQFGSFGLNAGTESQWTPETPKADNHFGYEGLEIQAIAAMNVHRLVIDMEVLRDYGYEEMFDAAFPDWPIDDRYTRETAGLAIAAYERTVLSNRAPFQRWLRGDRLAMDDSEKRGAVLFFGEAACVNCHTGPSLAKMSFEAIGMDDLDRCGEVVFLTPQDSEAHLGRGGFTGREEDKYKFKVPQLYNLTDSPFYGHGASFRSVREVVEYKNLGISQNDRVAADYLSDEFRPLNLDEQEIEDLTAFLELALYDPDLTRYAPDALPSGFCFPNNDTDTRDDRGCD